MNYSAKRTPVLVIEDDDEQISQLKRHFANTEFELKCFKPEDDEDLYNYKALHNESQIVIFDLNLHKGKGAFDPEEGMRLIRQYLWISDYTAFFIIFSRHLSSPSSLAPREGMLEPHWTYVNKKFTGKVLSQGCLELLVNTVRVCRRVSDARLGLPRYDSYDCLSVVTECVEDAAMVRGDGAVVIEESAKQSVDSLNVIAEGAKAFTLAGETVAQIGIGVYGSCGRLEMRPDSDVECSVFVPSTVPSATDSSVRLATVLWNRVVAYMRRRDLKFEGEKLIRGNRPPVLLVSQVDERLPNRFVPVMSMNAILKTDFEAEPTLRNRHFQVLTELRPVFNAEMLVDFKRRVITSGIGTEQTDLWTLVDHPYLEGLATQYSLDTSPAALKRLDYRNLKRFCYRTMGLIALRLCLIDELCFSDPKLSSDAGWQRLFDRLSDPGIIKVMRLANHCRKDGKSRWTAGAEEAFRKCIGSYVLLLQRFWRVSESKKRDTDAQYLITDVRQTVRSMEVLLKELAVSPAAALLKDRAGWLFQIASVSRTLDGL